MLTDIDASRLDLVASSFARDGARVAAIACDVRDAAAMAQLVDSAVATLGGIDLAINCAGVALAGAFHNSSAEEWQWIFDINMHGVANSCRPLIRHMARGKGGVIINISSVSRYGNAGQTNYSATKAGVAAMAEVWAKELARYGIRTGAIAPGYTRTDILSAMRPEILEKMTAQVPLRRLGDAAEIAATAVFIVENDFLTGRCIDVDGGMRL